MVYWDTGDVIAACIGGFLIGLATTLHLKFNGKLNGCGGVVDAFTGKGKDGNFGWKFSYFTGMISASYLIYLIFGRTLKLGSYDMVFFDSEVLVSAMLPWYAFVIGGFLNGLGMRMGRGCTSGHGINGIPSMSLGSLVSVCLFMVFGMAFANLCYHADFMRSGDQWGDSYTDFRYYFSIALFTLVVVVEAWVIMKADNRSGILATLLVGCLFGLGLAISGMCRVTKVLGFLTFSDNWDPSLAFVMGVGVTMNIFTFRHIHKSQEKPEFADKFIPRPEVPINMRTIVGASLFGVGWGIGGLCPGPAMIDFFNLNKVIIWMIAHCAAIIIVDRYDDKQKTVAAQTEGDVNQALLS